MDMLSAPLPPELTRVLRVESEEEAGASIFLDGIPLEYDSEGSESGGEEVEIPFPWEPSIACTYFYHSCYQKYIDVGVVRIMSPEEVSTSGREEVEVPPERGPKYYFLAPSFNRRLCLDIRSFAAQFYIQEPFVVVRPLDRQTVHTPPDGCIAVYKLAMLRGLRFPLHPFVVTLLSAYNLSIVSLVPNSWGTINAFLSICSMLRVAPTLRLWRNLVKLVESRSTDHGKGWYSFQCRFGYRFTSKLPSNQEGFRREFFFVFSSEGWEIPRVLEEEPNFGWNLQVPRMSAEEALVALYSEVDTDFSEGTNQYIPMNWLPSDKELNDDNFLSVVGLNLVYPEGRNSFSSYLHF